MNGQVAVVTGAGSGIGRAAALALHANGFRVVAAGRRRSAIEETAALATPDDHRVLAVPADVTDPNSVRELFAETTAAFGRVDVLFNNAGMNTASVPLEDLTFDQWDAVVNTNLTGSFLCAQQAIRIMKSQNPRGGRIINNGSISAHTPRPFSAPYTASKHAITGLTKSIALDGRAWDITCSQIDIGNAISPQTEKMAAGILQPNGATMVEARMDVEHVAQAVLYIANLPLDVNVLFMTVMATKMPFVGRG